jgi:hypothetical protein
MESFVKDLQSRLKEKDVIINKMGGNICELEAQVEKQEKYIARLERLLIMNCLLPELNKIKYPELFKNETL